METTTFIRDFWRAEERAARWAGWYRIGSRPVLRKGSVDRGTQEPIAESLQESPWVMAEAEERKHGEKMEIAREGIVWYPGEMEYGMPGIRVL